jgi:uncharacterized membrane protein
MWIISFLPEWVFHLILAIGVVGVIAGFVLGFIPIIKKYKLSIQIISILILCLGVYLQGGLADYKEWEHKASELKVKIADMEKQLAQTDTKVVEKVITKIQTVREKGKETIKYVDREVVKYDTKFLPGNECELPKDFFILYNNSLGKDIK